MFAHDILSLCLRPKHHLKYTYGGGGVSVTRFPLKEIIVPVGYSGLHC